MKEFKNFILRGNVVDLAVAVLLGAAFGAVVTAFTVNLLTPLIALVGGQPSFADMKLVVGKTEFGYGAFLDAVVAFLMVAAVLFFFVVRPLNRLAERRKTETPVGPVTRTCPECLSSIPQSARRCAFCTTQVPAA